MPSPMLGRIEMHVGAAFDLARERRQLEVVSREQRERLRLTRAMCRAIAQASDRPSKVLVPRPISSMRIRLRVGGVVAGCSRPRSSPP